MSEKKRDGFVFGALILSFSGLITKIAGLIFRVVLTRMIGGSADVINGITTVDATMSHFSSAYAVYFAVYIRVADRYFSDGFSFFGTRKV